MYICVCFIYLPDAFLGYNYFNMQIPQISYNFVDFFESYDPSTSDPWHGTNCGGVIGAVKDEETCGVGIAYNSNLGGKYVHISI